jgi:hypothetical protein
MSQEFSRRDTLQAAWGQGAATDVRDRHEPEIELITRL